MSNSHETTDFATLPLEVLLEICSNCPPQDLRNLSLTCRRVSKAVVISLAPEQGWLISTKDFQTTRDDLMLLSELVSIQEYLDQITSICVASGPGFFDAGRRTLHEYDGEDPPHPDDVRAWRVEAREARRFHSSDEAHNMLGDILRKLAKAKSFSSIVLPVFFGFENWRRLRMAATTVEDLALPLQIISEIGFDRPILAVEVTLSNEATNERVEKTVVEALQKYNSISLVDDVRILAPKHSNTEMWETDPVHRESIAPDVPLGLLQTLSHVNHLRIDSQHQRIPEEDAAACEFCFGNIDTALASQFTALTSIELCYVNVGQNLLCSFLTRHEGTLTTLKLKNVIIGSVDRVQSWQDVFYFLRRFDNLTDIEFGILQQFWAGGGEDLSEIGGEEEQAIVDKPLRLSGSIEVQNGLETLVKHFKLGYRMYDMGGSTVPQWFTAYVRHWAIMDIARNAEV